MRHVLIFAFCLTCFTSLRAEQYYVLFDVNCMDRLEYEQAISQQPRMAYFAYQIPLPNQQFLTLETGVEGNVTQDYLPAGYLSCGSPQLNAALVDRINGSTDRLFMLIPNGAGAYTVQPVTMASLRLSAGRTLSYESPLARFGFDTENGIIGENLAVNNPGARVYFEGRDKVACTHIYLFRQHMERNAYPVIDFKISQELGVIERRLGSDGNSTVGGVVVLRRVNGQPLSSYLTDYCANQQANYADAAAPQVYNNAPTISHPVQTQGPATYSSPIPHVGTIAPPTATPPTPSAPPATAAATHTVSRGQTLYAISRQYGLSVDELKQINGLTSNDIQIGQVLRVGRAAAPQGIADNSSTSAGTPSADSGQFLHYNRGVVAGSNPGAPQPVPYSNPATVPSGHSTTAAQQLYTVQPGETVASVALRLGYTEAKFREINNLGPREVVRVGQRLKTNDCNCPDQATVTVGPAVGAAAPSSYGSQVPAAPATYSQMPAVPSTYNRSPAAPAPYSTTPDNSSPATHTRSPNTTFNNDPNFGSVIPEAYQPPRQNMSQLESEAAPTNATPNPYGNTGLASPTPYNEPSRTRSVHTVQQGESLYSIATRYGLTVAQLRELNGMTTSDVIIPFQRLFIN